MLTLPLILTVLNYDNFLSHNQFSFVIITINPDIEGRKENYLLPGCQHGCRDKNQILLDGRFWYQQQSLKDNLKHENSSPLDNHFKNQRMIQKCISVDKLFGNVQHTRQYIPTPICTASVPVVVCK